MMLTARLRTWLRDDRIAALLFISPCILALCVAYLFPLIYSAYLSFCEWDIRTPGAPIELSGVDNYRDVLADGQFWSSVGRSLVFTLVALPAELLLGTLVALLLTNERLSGRLTGLSRVVLLVPLMVPPVVTGILWRLLFNVQYGPLNAALGFFGLNPQPWISQPDTAMAAVLVVEILTNTSIVAMILMGGMMALPQEPIRAAQMDGASPLRVLLEIKLPMLAHLYLIVGLIRLMDLLKTFDFIYAMTFGGPGVSTQTLNIYIVRLGSRFLEYPAAAAASWIFLLMLLPPSIYLLLKAVPRNQAYLND
ncbi:carbohydrate ABC transporter permease [Peristeroidobacter soli]|jgi:multiple sugar transport system permease protein|uniref:carbohydrate ABC transporter permease n=1 Tax=Peristeroidobacter soli TaxID=2497877 RepID=UPI00101D0508|nr:sugar ABC transporter permease [Peristeroidobacter soli]